MSGQIFRTVDYVTPINNTSYWSIAKNIPKTQRWIRPTRQSVTAVNTALVFADSGPSTLDGYVSYNSGSGGFTVLKGGYYHIDFSIPMGVDAAVPGAGKWRAILCSVPVQLSTPYCVATKANAITSGATLPYADSFAGSYTGYFAENDTFAVYVYVSGATVNTVSMVIGDGYYDPFIKVTCLGLPEIQK